MAEDPLGEYMSRPLEPPPLEVLEAIRRGPIDPGAALQAADVDRLVDPAPLEVETGWCTLDDGVGYVAVRTEMPAVTGEMVDWWFDWHPRDPRRYRAWHPKAHFDNSLEPSKRAGTKLHWGAVHHPVEDVGGGVVHARIAFHPPSEMGMSGDGLDHPDVATIVCGYAGDDRRRIRHTPMFHVFVRRREGVVLRSRFWLGAAIRPYGPAGAIGERVLNNRLTRRVALPGDLPRALATHCAEEYANLAVLLPELHARFGPGAT
ncbi:MAG: DAPG hydrolase family protein [Solirubrobacterales bacterium]